MPFEGTVRRSCLRDSLVESHGLSDYFFSLGISCVGGELVGHFAAVETESDPPHAMLE